MKLNGVVENSKCTLSFVSNMDATERDNILKAGVTYRRNTYRGKDITNYWNGTEKVNNRDLYQQISNCTFDDIYVGDYITGSNEVIWLIADLNNYLYAGNVDNGVEQCHATIIPARPLTNKQMNLENTSSGGYYGSNMVKNILGTEIQEGTEDILNKYIVPDFKDHIIKYRNLLSDSMDSTRVNQEGRLTNGSGAGASGSWSWYDRYLDLMSEVNVYGSIVWSSSGFDIGIDNRQYAIFRLKPEFVYSYGKTKINYWLKAVTSYIGFACADGGGGANNTYASRYFGVRPRFLIG